MKFVWTWTMEYLFFIGGMNAFFSLIRYFVYSQLFTSYFLKWHPNHENGKITYFLAIPQTSDTFKTCMSRILIGPIKIIVNPALVLAMILIVFDRTGLDKWYGGNEPTNIIFGIWKDWRHHTHWLFLYLMGYALISIESEKLDQILKNMVYCIYFVAFVFC